MNQFNREDISINQLSNGQKLEMRKFSLKGEEQGPHVHIQASVHGAEVQGNPVIYELMRFFTKVNLKGSLNLIPLVNPLGSNTKSGTYTQGRFNPVTGDNWNRNFINLIGYDSQITDIDLSTFWNEIRELPPREQAQKFKTLQKKGFKKIREHLNNYGLSDNVEMNLTLQEFACEADIVLDLHTGPAATRYLYAGEYALKKMKDIPFPHNLIIPNEFGGAMDEATFFPWTELTRIAHECGDSFINPFESYTVELGSEEIIDFKMARLDCTRLLIFLAERGFFSRDEIAKEYPKELDYIQKEKRYACLLSHYATYYAQKGGLIQYSKRPGDHIKMGEELYRILDFSDLHHLNDLDHCIDRVKALKDAIIINHTPSASVTKGTIAYQVMEEYYEL